MQNEPRNESATQAGTAATQDASKEAQPQAYFVSQGISEIDGVEYETLLPTSFTHGAWGPFQHGAPPSALLTRALERNPDVDSSMRTTRIAVDLLSAVPYTPLRVRSWVSRPGKQICKVEAEILAEIKGTWRPVASGSAWRMSTADTRDVERAFDQPIPGPDECTDHIAPLKEWPGGYIESIQSKSGPSIDPAGTKIHWVRTKHPVVEGEVPTPIERLMSVADTANGIGATLSPQTWAFMNTDLVVHLHRVPDLASLDDDYNPGWVGIHARGSIGPDGIGMTAGELYDEHGPIGRSMQTLLVRPQ